MTSETDLAQLGARLAALPEGDRRAVLAAEFGPEELEQLDYAWPLWARADQLPPPGDWRCWLLRPWQREDV
jgi:hypothetical protein